MPPEDTEGVIGLKSMVYYLFIYCKQDKARCPFGVDKLNNYISKFDVNNLETDNIT